MGILPKLHILGLPRGTPTVWLPPNSAEGTSLGGRLGRTGYTPGLAQPTTRHCGNFPWKQRPGWALPHRVWLSSRSHPQGCPLSLPAPFSPSPSLALAAEASPDHHPAPAQHPCSARSPCSSQHHAHILADPAVTQTLVVVASGRSWHRLWAATRTQRSLFLPERGRLPSRPVLPLAWQGDRDQERQQVTET